MIIHLPCAVRYVGSNSDIPRDVVLISVVNRNFVNRDLDFKTLEEEEPAFVMSRNRIYGVLLSQLIPAI